MNSSHVVTTFGHNACRKLETFTRSYVQPHEQHFCFFQRLSICHMDMYSNTPHEGTNNGIKAYAAPSMPQYSIVTAARVLCANSEVNAIQRGRESATLLMGHKLLSKTKTADYVTSNAENEIKNQASEIHSYHLMRLHSSNWREQQQQQHKPLQCLHFDELGQDAALTDASIHIVGRRQPKVIPQFD
jgi:hypothetical protein